MVSIQYKDIPDWDWDQPTPLPIMYDREKEREVVAPHIQQRSGKQFQGHKFRLGGPKK